MSGSCPGRVGIIGLGLMGGSLARSLKTLPDPPHIRALSLDHSDLGKALEEGGIDEGMHEPREFFDGLDLVVYCTPLNATLQLLEGHNHLLDSDSIVTDVVSLKTPIMKKVEALRLRVPFVGSHPMAGGEGSGFGASREGLFQGATVWIVPGGATDRAITLVEDFWGCVGAHGTRIQAENHDDLMAWVSHLPQLTANALALVLGERGIRRDELGSGGRDMTRLAGSAPEMWKDLFENAPEGLLDALASLEEALSGVRAKIRGGQGAEVADLLRRTRRWYEGDGWT